MTDDTLIRLQQEIDALSNRLEHLEIAEHNRFSDLFLKADEAGLNYRVNGNYNLRTGFEGFDGTAMPAGWTWAGAPFVTPATVSFSTYPSAMSIGWSATAGERAFLYQSMAPSGISCILGLQSLQATFCAGIRLDDGTDNNYVEYKMSVITALPTEHGIRTSVRTGGGAVTDTNQAGTWFVPLKSPQMVLSIAGTKWTNWNVQPLLYGQNLTGGTFWKAVFATGLTWTPTRAGLVFMDGGGATTWDRAMVDAIALNV